MAKAPIYSEQDHPIAEEALAHLRSMCEHLREYAPANLMLQLRNAVDALQEALKANRPVYQGAKAIGFGVVKAQKAIACDNVITIVRQIKTLKAW